MPATFRKQKCEEEDTGEEDALEEKRKIIQNSEKIAENLNKADCLISESGIESISTAIRMLEKIEDIDTKYEKASSNLKSICGKTKEEGFNIK